MRHRTFQKYAVAAAALATTLSLQAEVKLPALLSDNMVLQQESEARFWGWAAPGEQVKVQGSWGKHFSAPVTAGEEGKWKTTLKTPKAGGPYTVTVKGANTIENKTVVVSSDMVAKPVAVRYAFDNAGVPSLFNKEGLPASSFRTDEW